MLKDNMAILVAHILVDHFVFSEDFKGLATWHIPHQFSVQMARKSEIVSLKINMYTTYRLLFLAWQVPLGVLPYNE